MNDRKLAFLFLMRGGHNQPELWREFLDGQANDYSVYLHAKRPRCVGDRFWRQALIKQRYATRWGDISLVKATLALMNAALADPRNDKLILLSESCVPIKPFTTVRNTLLRDQYGYMAWLRASKVHPPAKARRMSQARNIQAAHYLFHPQWIVFSREMARVLMENDRTEWFRRVHAPDECYFGSVLASIGFDFPARIHKLCLTHVNWDAPRRSHAHPYRYGLLKEAEAETLRSSPCLFARKFGPESSIGQYRLHLPPGHSCADAGSDRADSPATAVAQRCGSFPNRM